MNIKEESAKQYFHYFDNTSVHKSGGDGMDGFRFLRTWRNTKTELGKFIEDNSPTVWGYPTKERIESERKNHEYLQELY